MIARADKAGKMGTMIDALDIESTENEGAGLGAGGSIPLRSKKRKLMPPLKGQPQAAMQYRHPLACLLHIDSLSVNSRTKKPKMTTPTQGALGPPQAGAIVSSGDEQPPTQGISVLPPQVDSNTSVALATENAMVEVTSGSESTSGEELEESAAALDEQQEDEDEEEAEEGELGSDSQQEAAESEPEQSDSISQLSRSPEDEEDVEAEDDEVESDTSFSADGVMDEGLAPNLFTRRSQPRYARANSKRRFICFHLNCSWVILISLSQQDDTCTTYPTA